MVEKLSLRKFEDFLEAFGKSIEQVFGNSTFHQKKTIWWHREEKSWTSFYLKSPGFCIKRIQLFRKTKNVRQNNYSNEKLKMKKTMQKLDNRILRPRRSQLEVIFFLWQWSQKKMKELEQSIEKHCIIRISSFAGSLLFFSAIQKKHQVS
jgi:hypothetical protein